MCYRLLAPRRLIGCRPLAALFVAATCAFACSPEPQKDDDSADTVVDVVSDTEPVDTEPVDTKPPECEADKDCEAPAKDSCQVARCDAGTCVIEKAAVGATCDDENVCTDPDTCQDGGGGKLTCTGPKVCACEKTADCADKNDQNPCTPDYFCDVKTHTCEIKLSSIVTCSSETPDPCVANKCDPKDGKCRLFPLDGKACDDGLACSTASACKKGSCAPTKVDPTCQCQIDSDCKDDGKPCNGVLYCDKTANLCRVNKASVIKCPTNKNGPCVTWTCDDADGSCKPKLLNPAKIPAKGIPTDAQSNCDTDGTSCSQELCKNGVCEHIKYVPPCGCNTTADCKTHEDGNVCNGTLYCEKATGTCRPNPATVVTCPTIHDLPCRRATCDPKDGLCKLKTLKDDTVCYDGLPCTVEARCKKARCELTKSKCFCTKTADCAKHEGDIENKCLGTKLYCDKKIGQCRLNPASRPLCDDAADTECLKNRCRPEKGTCAPVPMLEGSPCEFDGTACTAPDRCKDGVCTVGENSCPCKDTKDCGQFEDGDVCNGILYCDKAKKDKSTWFCKVNATSVKACPDGKDVCAPNVCDPKTGTCKVNAEPDGQPCEADDSSCSQEACKGGVCKVELNVCQCPLGDDCTDFEDGNPCNGTLYCDKTGAKENWACKVNPKTVVKCKLSAGELCKQAQCDPKDGNCKPLAFNAGVPCVDKDLCTLATTCKGGDCVQAPGAATLACDDQNVCTDDSCDATKGCLFKVAKGKKCDDDNACTPGDACTDTAVCLGGAATACNDGNACTADSCDKKVGCVFKASAGKACNDGNACTLNTTCQASGVCGGATKQLVCNDNNPCTDDSCSAKTGCVAVANKAGCDDGNACTDKDACSGGKCTGATVTCSKKGACDGTCDPKKGCQYVSKPEICDGKDNDCDGKTDNGCDEDGDGHCTEKMQVTAGALCTKTLQAATSGCAKQLLGDSSPTSAVKTLVLGAGTLGANGQPNDRAFAFWHPKRAEIWQVRHVGSKPARSEATVARYAPSGALMGMFSATAPGNRMKAACGSADSDDWFVSHVANGVIRIKGMGGNAVWQMFPQKAGKKVAISTVAAGANVLYAASGQANDPTVFRVNATDGKTLGTFTLKRPGTDHHVLSMALGKFHFYVQHNHGESTKDFTILRRYDMTGTKMLGTMKLPAATTLPALFVDGLICLGKTGFGAWSCFDTATPACKNGDDCDDNKPKLAPSEAEICDGVDNNCDGNVDEWCDVDKDGYCAKDKVVVSGASCTKDIATGKGRDCLDGDATGRPGAFDHCDGLDNNCNGNIDEKCDDDGDGHCDPNIGVRATALCSGTLGPRSHCPGVINDSDVYITHQLKLQPKGTLKGQLRGGYHGFFREYWVGSLGSKAPTVMHRFDADGREVGTKTLQIPGITGFVGHALIGDFFVSSMQKGATRIDAKGKTVWNELNSARAIALHSGAVWVAIGTNSRIQQLHHANGSKTGEFDLLPANKVDVMVPVQGWLFSVLNNAKVLSRHHQTTRKLHWNFALDHQPTLGLFDGRFLCTSRDKLTLDCHNILRPNCAKGDDCNDNKSDAKPSIPEWCDGLDNDCDKHTDEGCDDDGDGFCDVAMGVAKGAKCTKTLSEMGRCAGVEGRIDTFPFDPKKPYKAPVGDDLRNDKLAGGGHPFREEIWLLREPSSGTFGIQRLEPQPLTTDFRMVALGTIPLAGQPRPAALAGAVKSDHWYSCHALTGTKKSLTKYQGASTKAVGVLGTTDDCTAVYEDGTFVYRVGKQAPHVVFKWTTDGNHTFKAAGFVQLKGVQSASYLGVGGGRFVVGDRLGKRHRIFNTKGQVAAVMALDQAEPFHFFAAPWVWMKRANAADTIALTAVVKGDCSKAGDDCDDNDTNVFPGGERICDGKDDDCDGRVDEGCDRDGDGLCAVGMQVAAQGGPCGKNAAGGKGTDCRPDAKNLPLPKEVVCDGKDDDCDGQIDNGCDDDGDGHCDKKMNLAAGATCKATLGDASGCAYRARVSTVLVDPAKKGVVAAAAGTAMHESTGGGHPFRDEIWLVRPHAKSSGPYHVERYDAVLNNDHKLRQLGTFSLGGLSHPNGLAGDPTRDVWYRCHKTESGRVVSVHAGTSALAGPAITAGGDCHAIFAVNSTLYAMTTDKPGIIQGFSTKNLAPVLSRKLEGADNTIQFIGTTGPYYLAGNKTTEGLYSAVTGKLVGKAKAGFNARRGFYAAPYVWTPKTGVTWTLRNLWPGLVPEPLCKAGDDCNDNSDSVRPPFERVCDGADSDCDGAIDEGCDRDGDGRCRLGAKITSKGPCAADLKQGLQAGSDCGDGDPLVPYGSEQVCNGQDDNCDGKVDEGCDDDADGFCDKGMKVAPGATCPHTFKDLLSRCPVVEKQAGNPVQMTPDVGAVDLKLGGLYYHAFRREWWAYEDASGNPGTVFRFKADGKLTFMGRFRIKPRITLPLTGDDRTDTAYTIQSGSVVRSGGFVVNDLWKSANVGAAVGLSVDGERVWTSHTASGNPFELVALRRDSGFRDTTITVADQDGASTVYIGVRMFAVVGGIIYAKTRGTSTGPITAFSETGAVMRDVIDYKRPTHLHMFRATTRLCVQEANWTSGVANALKPWCYPLFAAACSKGDDCDDTNSAIKPGAVEPCALKDINCDGATGMCEDGNLCTVGDVCAGTQCKGGKSCDDGEECTADSCDAKKGCVFKHRSGTCEDDNPCTNKGACNSGRCTSGSKKTNETPCDDGNACTTNTVCLNGVCRVKVTKSGVFATTVGTGISGSVDGPVQVTHINAPKTLAFDPAGRLWFGTEDGRIRRLDDDGQVRTIVGASGKGDADGPFNVAKINAPTMLAAGRDGHIYFADARLHIRRLRTDTDIVERVAGKGAPGIVDGPLGHGSFKDVHAMVQLKDGTWLLADAANHAIRTLDEHGNLGRIAGDGTAGAKDGFGTKAQFSGPGDIALSHDGRSAYVRDASNKGSIRQIRLINNQVTTLVKNIQHTPGLAVDSAGAIYYFAGHQLRRRRSPFDITSLTGNTPGFLDGPADQARIAAPAKMAFDATGKLFFTEPTLHRIRTVDFGDQFCRIANACYKRGDRNPKQPCEVCEPANNAFAWSLADEGLSCGGDNICQGPGACGCAMGQKDAAGLCMPCSCGPGALLTDAKTMHRSAVLRAANGETNASFGGVVAVDGETLMIGSRSANSSRGQVRIYERHPINGWQPTNTINGVDPKGVFGDSVALEGDTAVVGATNARPYDNLAPQGAAYILRRKNGTWTLTATLKASDVKFHHSLGASVALAGGIAGVGSQLTNGTGAVYLYSDASGSWFQTAKLRPSALKNNDKFGGPRSLAMTDGWLFAGATGHDKKGNDAGAVFAFTQSGGQAKLQQTLLPTATFSGGYGVVAFHGDRLVVGAPKEFVSGNTRGAVYIYRQAPNVSSAEPWQLAAKLQPPGLSSGAQFGHSVAIRGTSLVVGAPGDTVGATINAGTAFLYGLQLNDTWSLARRIDAGIEPIKASKFGFHVATSGTEAFIGAPEDSVVKSKAGAVHVFSGAALCQPDGPCVCRPGWKGARCDQHVCGPKRDCDDGNSCTLDRCAGGDTCKHSSVAAETSCDDGNACTTNKCDGSPNGAACKFNGNASNGSKCDDGEPCTLSDACQFGLCKAGNAASNGSKCGQTGTCQSAKCGCPDPGTSLVEGVCQFCGCEDGAKANVSNLKRDLLNTAGGSIQSYERTAQAVDVDGDRMIIGTQNYSPTTLGVGHVRLYKRNATTGRFATDGKTIHSPIKAQWSGFGQQVAISGDTFAATLSLAQIVHIYQRGADANWTPQAALSSPGPEGQGFGRSLAFCGDRLWVGHPHAPDAQNQHGIVWLFERSGAKWSRGAPVHPTGLGKTDRLADIGGLDCEGDLVAMGSAHHANGQGAVWLLRYKQGQWQTEAKLAPPSGFENGRFGTVALSGARLLVGVPHHSSKRGAAVLFSRASGSWKHVQTMVPKSAASGSRYGASVALAGELAMIGGPGAPRGAKNGVGMVELWTESGGTFKFSRTLLSKDIEKTLGFGWAVQFAGKDAVVMKGGGAHEPEISVFRANATCSTTGQCSCLPNWTGTRCEIPK